MGLVDTSPTKSYVDGPVTDSDQRTAVGQGTLVAIAVVGLGMLGGMILSSNTTNSQDNAISESGTAQVLSSIKANYNVPAGISPVTHKLMYTTAADAPSLNASDAMSYCKATGGHVPAKGELNVMFQNHAAIGGFNETGRYLSSTDSSEWNKSWGQNFGDGNQDQYDRSGVFALRCVL